MSEGTGVEGFEKQLAALRVAFEARLGERLAELEAARDGLDAASGETARGQALDHVARLAHGISGSAATFGYPEFSKLAERLEIACPTDSDVEDKLRQLIDAIRATQSAQATQSES